MANLYKLTYLVVTSAFVVLPLSAWADFSIDAPWLGGLLGGTFNQILCKPNDAGENQLYLTPSKEFGERKISGKRLAKILNDADSVLGTISANAQTLRKQLSKLKSQNT